ncbi:MAG: response regulator, partial [Bacteroidales bacterium]
WNSWWAWILYILLLAITIYFIFRYKWYQLQKSYHEEKIRFFINTAHDIRTPLTLATAPLEDLQNEDNLSSNATYLLNIARQNIHKLNSITSRFLEFEKIDSGNYRLKPVTIDLRNILREEVGCFQNLCDKKNIRLSLTMPESPVCVSGDSYLLEMIFDNLMSNACKYTDANGFIKVVMTAFQNKVTVDIIDSGIGIPLNDHKHIFSDIYRAKNARDSQQPGTGFGLLQVKRIVKMLKGNIEFKSIEGEGTTFSVSFSRVYEDVEVQPKHTSASYPTDELAVSIPDRQNEINSDKDITLLIVEDNDDLRHYLSKIFASDYTVVAMSTADKAQVYLTTEYPDLIISDVMMPGMQGDDFCRTIKNTPETSGIPVILLTAKTNHDSIVNGLQKGADDYVAKPFSSEILKLKVKGLIENRNRLRNFLLKQAVDQVTPDRTTSVLEEKADSPKELDLSDSDHIFMVKVTDIVIRNLSDTEFNIDTLCLEMAMSRTLFTAD